MYYDDGRDQQAAAAARQILHLSPNRVYTSGNDPGSACQLLGLLALRGNNPAKALEHFDSGLKMLPKERSIQLNRASSPLNNSGLRQKNTSTTREKKGQTTI